MMRGRRIRARRGSAIPPAAGYPATLPALALWLDGRLAASSDAGTTLATAPFGRVQQIAQPAPLTGNWTATGVSRPWKESNALDFHYFAPGHARGSMLTQPASSAIVGNNCTVALSWMQRVGYFNSQLFSAPVGAGTFGLYFGGNGTLACSTGLSAIVGPPVLSAGHYSVKCTMIIVCGPTQYDVRLTIDGVAYTGVVAVVPDPGIVGTFVLGANSVGSLASLNCGIAISQFAVFATALGGAALNNLQAFLLANAPGDYPVSAPLVTMSGDSIAAAWSPGVQGDLDAGATPIRWMNVGVAGAHVTIPAEIPSYFTTDALPHYSALRTKNIIVCEGISVNDIAYRIAQGDSVAAAAAAVLAGYYAYCDHAKAAGYIVIVCTLTPNLGGATYDAIRVIVNADIRANWAAHGAFFADIGATVGMATTADAANTTYFSDGTHPTPAGYVLLDATLLPVVAAALAA